MKTMDPCIRLVKLTHLDTIIKIEIGSYTTPWPSSVFVDELQHDWSTMWGFYPEGYRVPVAFLLFWEIYDELHILNIAVHPNFRRQGIARRLLTSLIEHGRERNFKYLTLEVRQSNIAALRLYRSLKFKVKGIRKGYYSDNCEDALIMASHLNNSEEMACSL